MLRGAESARRTVVATVDSVAQIDPQGWRATLAVERDLAADGAAGESIAIGWEEFVEGRPPRFAKGERVLVALDPLPGWSLWRQRFPDGKALAVAERGAAFLRDPDAATVDAVARYLRVAPAERAESAGVEALSRLVAEAADEIARGGVERLDAVAGLGGKLREPAATALGAAIADETRTEPLRRAILSLAGERQLDALRAPIAALAERRGPLAAAAWSALGAIDGGLPAEVVKRLLADPEAELRTVAVRYAAGTPEQARATQAMRSDPSPAVRAAAAEAMIATREPAAIAAGYDALFDPESDVRLAAAQALGQLGAETVPRLRELALERSGEAASGPLGALAFAGPEGHAALLELGHTHPDPKARGLARMLLGLDPRPH